FAAHPSVSLVKADYPVDAIWRAVLDQDDKALAAIDLAAGPVWLAVQRLSAGVDVARLAEREWRFVAAPCAGAGPGAGLGAAAGIEAPALLAQQLASGRFIGFSLPDGTRAAVTQEAGS